MRRHIAILLFLAPVFTAWLTSKSWSVEPRQSAEKAASQAGQVEVAPALSDRKVAPFPDRGILPKAEIGALRLLEKYPDYDGRGAVVAIFDTGVDPGAAGLQTTSDGRPKIIDMIDGTGGGDVVTSTVRKVEGGSIQGLSGRELKLDSNRIKDGSEVHLGLKSAYQLFPGPLVGRVKHERRKKFDKQQRAIEVALHRQILAWDDGHKDPTPEQKIERADLQARLDQLKAAAEGYDDPGPVLDCIVFKDGTGDDAVWRAIVDTDEDGDLTDETALTNYRDEHQFATFGDEAQLNFTVNILEDGNLLSIVVDSAAHGTHVAGIVAAHFPDQPELNGIAPGAQIVSVKIGDTRLGGIETGSGLERGLIAAVRNKCDVINMSFGEPSTMPNRGRLSELFSEVVHQHGIVFVAAAGNSGPALSTIICPGGTNSAVISVGAYVSPEMMKAEYSMREKLPEMAYTFSSRGPTFDGALGVDFCAPGGAISPVPTWTLSREMQMNGTSMATPNASGAIALLVSAAKAAEIPCSPPSIRRALKNTVRNVDGADAFAQGAGLIQVDRALEYLKQHAGDTGEQRWFKVSLPEQTGRRGIYLREPHQLRRPLVVKAHVHAIFPDDVDNKEKIKFDMRLSLQSTQPWVEVGQHAYLNYGGASFGARIDPTGLSAGVHFAEILASDATRSQRGPIFRIPITVIKPEQVSVDEFTLRGKHSFRPAEIHRRFIAVPKDATWLDLTMRRTDEQGKRVFVVQTIQRRDGQTYRDGETSHRETLAPGAEIIRSIPVEGGRTIEVCIAQYWSSLGKSELEYEVEFHGIVPDDRQPTLAGADSTTRVVLSSPLREATIAPSATLNTYRRAVLPSKAEVRPLDQQRDTLPDGKLVYRLLLTYEFEQESAGTVKPRFPANEGLLYESSWGTHLGMLFDETKRLIRTTHVWPSAIQLGKGKHTLRLQLRHTDPSRLEKLKAAPLYLDRPLKSPMSIAMYPSQAAAHHKSPGFGGRKLAAGETVAVHFACPPQADLPDAVKSGDLLLGNVAYGKADSARSGAGKRPGGFPLSCVIQQAKTPAPADSPSPPAKKPAGDKKKKAADELFDFKLGQLKKLTAEDDAARFEKVAARLLKKRPNHLPILVARLHRLDHEEHRKNRLPEVVAAADAIIAQIDIDQLARHFGTRQDSADPTAEQQHKELEQRRKTLLDALYRKGRALGFMELPEVIKQHPIEDPAAHDKAFEDNFKALQRWVDTTDKEYFLLHVRRERRQGRYGKALELLNKTVKDIAPDKTYFKKRCDVYKELGWQHIWEHEQRRMLIQFPTDYAPF